MTGRRRSGTRAIVVALVLVGAACGSSDDPGASSQGDGVPSVSTASLDDLEIDVRRDPG